MGFQMVSRKYIAHEQARRSELTESGLGRQMAKRTRPINQHGAARITDADAEGVFCPGKNGMEIEAPVNYSSARLQQLGSNENFNPQPQAEAIAPANGDSGIRGFLDALTPAAPTILLISSWKEVLAAVSEFVREATEVAESRVARFADICVDFMKMEVSRISGEVITLTNQEFKILRCFLSFPERVLSRDELLFEAWGYENYPSTRTVDNHVLKLRQKLEQDPARPVHFRTVHSVGYKFVP